MTADEARAAREAVRYLAGVRLKLESFREELREDWRAASQISELLSSIETCAAFLGESAREPAIIKCGTRPGGHAWVENDVNENTAYCAECRVQRGIWKRYEKWAGSLGGSQRPSTRPPRLAYPTPTRLLVECKSCGFATADPDEIYRIRENAPPGADPGRTSMYCPKCKHSLTRKIDYDVEEDIVRVVES